eukprot:scpid89089/ scgid0907/ 
MDSETKSRIAICILLPVCTMVMIRIISPENHLTLPMVTNTRLCRRRKRDVYDFVDEDDTEEDLLAILPLTMFGRRKRRFWCALRSPGAWNDDVIQHWATMGTCIEWDVSDWENEQYRLHLRMSKDAFRTLHEEVGGWLERCTTNYRAPVSSAKRLAVTLHWLSQGVFPRECSQGVLLRTTARAIGAPVPLFWAT